VCDKGSGVVETKYGGLQVAKFGICVTKVVKTKYGGLKWQNSESRCVTKVVETKFCGL
jgi:hypothetical protein